MGGRGGQGGRARAGEGVDGGGRFGRGTDAGEERAFSSGCTLVVGNLSRRGLRVMFSRRMG